MQRGRRRTRAAILVLAGVSLALLLVTFWARAQFRERAGWVTHTQVVIAALGDLRAAINRAETLYTGFLLTGEKSRMVDFEQNAAEIDRRFRTLEELVSDNAGQRLRMQALRPLIDSQVAELRAISDVRSRGNVQAAISLYQAGSAARTAREIDFIAGQLRQDEERLLEERRRARGRIDTLINSLLIAGFGITISALVWAFLALRRYERQRDLIDDQLQRLNRELETRVEERTADLKRSNQDLEQFAYAASHDLQEPLRMVSSYVDLLRRRYRGKLDGDADAYIQFAVDGAKRMQRMVNDLLAYSRAGTQALRLEVVDVGEILNEVLRDLQSSIESSRAQITVEPMPEIKADRVKASSVFLNLISNSIKFAKAGIPPRIEIGARQAGSEWEFTVRDNGIGFDTQYTEKVFQLFQRLHGGDNYPGSGIGLAMCKRIVDGHGGRIWVESQVGEGTTFHLTFPAAHVALRSAAIK